MGSSSSRISSSDGLPLLGQSYLLFDLGDDLLIHILSQWLGMQSLSRMDIAVSDRTTRFHWIRCLSAIKESSSIDEWQYCYLALKWLIRRGISPRRLQITSTSYSSPVEGAKLPSLLSLILKGCANSTDESVLAITQGCPQLEHINILGSINISDSTLSSLSIQCPHLRHASFGWSR